MVKIESKPKEKGELLGLVEKTFQLVGEVLCPYCAPKMFTVHHEPSPKNFFIWKVSNYVRHLKKLHPREVADDVQTVKNENAANTNLIQNDASPGGAKNTESVNAYFHNKNSNILTTEDEAIEDIQTEHKAIATTSISNQYNSIASGSTKIELPNINFQSVGQSNLVDYSDSGASSDEDDCITNDRYGKLDCPYYFFIGHNFFL